MRNGEGIYVNESSEEPFQKMATNPRRQKAHPRLLGEGGLTKGPGTLADRWPGHHLACAGFTGTFVRQTNQTGHFKYMHLMHVNYTFRKVKKKKTHFLSLRFTKDTSNFKRL